MKIKNFSLDVLEKHKAFFLLDKMPKFLPNVDIMISTPKGFEEVDFVECFHMADGSVLAAWEHPTQKLGLQNLVAVSGDYSQVLNLYPVERVVGILDKKLGFTNGFFYFAPSREVAWADWRCDRGVYGVRSFMQDFPEPVVSSLDDIVVYESFLSVAGIAHLFYIGFSSDDFVTNEKFNDLVVPVAGRTLQEVVRLIWEWKELATPPFVGVDEATRIAYGFWNSMLFSEEENNWVSSLPPMQIHNFLAGSTTARNQPDNLIETTGTTIEMIVSRMAASSLSFLVSRNPNLWTLDEILVKENIELENGIKRFRDYYVLPNHVSLWDENSVQEYAQIFRPKEQAYIHNQLNNFKNKKMVLDCVARGDDIWS
jgi:hypothetical protein